MFVREVLKPNGSVSIRIVESVRSGNKVIQKTIRSLGQHKDPKEIEVIKKAAEQLIVEIENNRNPVLSIFDPSDFHAVKKRKQKLHEAETPEAGIGIKNIESLKEEARTNDGIYDIFSPLYEQLGFDSFITDTRQDELWNQTLEACVLARIAQPASKLKTARFIEEQFQWKIESDHLYRMMDHVAAHEEEIKKRIALQTQSLFKEKIKLLLFDVTTLYFESTQADELRDFGFSKDCKFNQTQVVLALITNSEGAPMGYELFSGKSSETKTLVEVVKSMKDSYQLEEVILVADRAMFSQNNLEYLESLNVKYVVAAKLRGMSKVLQTEILESKAFQAKEVLGQLHWVNEFEVQSARRLIVSYSSARAKKDKADRERILTKLKKKMKEEEIKVENLLSNQGSKKYVEVSKLKAKLDPAKIERDAAWDGFHGLITNVKDEKLEELLSRYRDLWKIEEAFRVNKHDLKMRPIYHWKAKRIRAHIAICYIAYALISYAQQRLRKNKIQMSAEVLREELLKAQSSHVRDEASKNIIVIPSKLSPLQKEIYNAFGLIRKQKASLLTS